MSNQPNNSLDLEPSAPISFESSLEDLGIPEDIILFLKANNINCAGHFLDLDIDLITDRIKKELNAAKEAAENSIVR